MEATCGASELGFPSGEWVSGRAARVELLPGGLGEFTQVHGRLGKEGEVGSEDSRFRGGWVRVCDRGHAGGACGERRQGNVRRLLCG